MRMREYTKANWPGFLRSVRETGQIYRNTVVGGRTESGVRYYLGLAEVDTIRIHASESHPLTLSFVHGNDDDHQPQTSLASITASVDLEVPENFDETKYGGLTHGTLIWLVAWQDETSGEVTFDLVPDSWYSNNIYMKDNVVWNKASGSDVACRMIQIGTCFALYDGTEATWTIDGLSYVPSQNDTVSAVGAMNPYDGDDVGVDEPWILGVSSEGGWHRIDKDGNSVTISGTIDKVNGCHTGLNDCPIFRDIETVAIDSAHGTQIAVKFSKFWYKRTGTGLAGAPYILLIADREVEGFSKASAFALKDQFYAGAYTCGGANYDSIAGLSPTVNVSFTAKQAAIPAKHGVGWNMWDIHQLSAIQMLFLVEFGSPDAQTLIGAGRSSASSAVVNGGSNAIYRGLHEMWGNVAQAVDGIKGNASSEIQLFNPDGSRTYVATGVVPVAGPLSYGTGSVTSLMDDSGVDYDLKAISLRGADGVASFGDQASGPIASFCFHHGGSWTGADGCGMFCSHLTHKFTDVFNFAGVRMSKI